MAVDGLNGEAKDRGGRIGGASPVAVTAIDIDDTLINSRLEITPRTAKAIAAALERGVRVVLATGRMYASARPFAERLGLQGPLIAYNGALVKTVAGRTIAHRPLPLELARQVLDLAADAGWTVNAYVDDRMYVSSIDDGVRYYMGISGRPAHAVGDLAAYLTHDPTKLVIITEPDKAPTIRDTIAERFGQLLTVSISKPRFVEITRGGVSKGTALHDVAAYYGVPLSRVMAIGDGFNDLDMIRTAGIGVAMGNAPQAVREAADHVTATNEEDGVALAIERWVLQQPWFRAAN